MMQGTRHSPFTGFVDDVLDSSAVIQDLGAGEAAALTGAIWSIVWTGLAGGQ